MPLNRFGPFASAFEPVERQVPGYLELLGLPNRRGAQIAIERIDVARTDGDPGPWVAAMLAQDGWRPHLVAAVVYLLERPLRLDTALLWSAVDAGSWVIPQLVVTALFCDPLFARRARQRLDAGCPTVRCDAHPLEPDQVAKSGKMAASLLALCSQVPELAASEAKWRSDREILALLAEDSSWDSSDEITSGWRSNVSACFAERGLKLAPPRA